MGNFCSKPAPKEKNIDNTKQCTDPSQTTNTIGATIGHWLGKGLTWSIGLPLRIFGLDKEIESRVDKAVGYNPELDDPINKTIEKVVKNMFGITWKELKFWISVIGIAIGIVIFLILFGEFIMPLLPYIEQGIMMAIDGLVKLLKLVWRIFALVFNVVTGSILDLSGEGPDWLFPLFIGIALLVVFGIYFTEAGKRGLGGFIFWLFGCTYGTNPNDHSGTDNNFIQKFGHLFSSLIRYILAFFGYSFSIASKDLGDWLTGLGVYFARINDFIWGYRENLKCMNSQPASSGNVGDHPSATPCN